MGWCKRKHMCFPQQLKINWLKWIKLQIGIRNIEIFAFVERDLGYNNLKNWNEDNEIQSNLQVSELNCRRRWCNDVSGLPQRPRGLLFALSSDHLRSHEATCMLCTINTSFIVSVESDASNILSCRDTLGCNHRSSLISLSIPDFPISCERASETKSVNRSST